MTGSFALKALFASTTRSPDQRMKLFTFTREPEGIANASSTPAMVECTPDMNTQYHNTAPTSRYAYNENTWRLFMSKSAQKTTAAQPSHGKDGACP